MASDRRLLIAERPSSVGFYVRQSGSGWRQHHRFQYFARPGLQPDRKRDILLPDRDLTPLVKRH